MQRASADSVQYLEGLGFSYGQAHTAVYNYRRDHHRGQSR
jgi:hypothetical protein